MFNFLSGNTNSSNSVETKNREDKEEVHPSNASKMFTKESGQSMFQGLSMKSTSKQPDPGSGHYPPKRGGSDTEGGPGYSAKASGTKFSFLNAPMQAPKGSIEKPSTKSFSFIDATSKTKVASFDQQSQGSAVSSSVSTGAFAQKEDSSDLRDDREVTAASIASTENSILAGLKIHSQYSNVVQESSNPIVSQTEGIEEKAHKDSSEVLPGQDIGENEEPQNTGETKVQERNQGKEEDPFASVGKEGEKVEDDKDYEFIQNDHEIPSEIVQGEFAQLLGAFRRTVNKYIKDVTEINSSFTDLSNQKAHFESNLEEVMTLLAQLQAQQNAASEAEDFTKAEELQRSIDRHTREKGAYQSRIEDLRKREETLNAKREDLFEGQISSIETIRSLLQDCSENESKRAEEYREEAEKQYRRKSAELSDEEDLLRLRTEHIEHDIGVLEKEQAQIDEKIESGTRNLRSSRDEWVSRIEIVSAEITELEKQLKEKYDLRTDYNEKLSEIDDEIAIVKSKYQTRVEELKTRKSVIDEKRTEAEEQAERMEKVRIDLKDTLEQKQEKSRELKKLAESVASQLVILEKISDRLRNETEERRKSIEDMQQDKQQLEKLFDEVKSNQQDLSLLEKQQSQMESKVMEFTGKLLELENKLPALNEQKRLAVSTRNFKQAARIAAQVKSLKSEQENTEELLTQEKTKVQDIKNSINQKDKALKSSLENYESLQASLNERRLKTVLEKTKTLKQNLEQVQELGITDKGTFGYTIIKLLSIDIDSYALEAAEVAEKLGNPSLADDVFEKEETNVQKNESENANNTDKRKESENEDKPLDKEAISKHIKEADEKMESLRMRIDEAVEQEDYEAAALTEEKRKEVEATRLTLIETFGGQDAYEEYLSSRQDCDVDEEFEEGRENHPSQAREEDSAKQEKAEITIDSRKEELATQQEDADHEPNAKENGDIKERESGEVSDRVEEYDNQREEGD